MRSTTRSDPQVRALIGAALAGLDRPPAARPARSRPRRVHTWHAFGLLLVAGAILVRLTTGAASEPAPTASVHRISGHGYLVPTVRATLDAHRWQESARQLTRSQRDAARAAAECTGSYDTLLAPSPPGVTGPSAGLLLALALVDDLLPDDLTRGRVIAGTGTIDATGNVGRIAALPAKVAASERAGAEIFLAPADQADEAAAAATTMTVVGIHTLDEALRVLGAGGCGT